MTKRHPDDPNPTWFRLSPETWALIRDEYVAGATARELAKKYRTSPTSIYRHASVEGWTKEALGDAVAREDAADAERRAREEEAALAAAAARDAEALTRFSNTPDAVAELERRALEQAGEAMSKGRPGEAKQFAALADQLRKRINAVRAEQDQDREPGFQSQNEAEEVIYFFFNKVAFIAHAMVHAPTEAPAAFQMLIKLWREKNLGEGEEDAEKVAAIIAASQTAWFERRTHEFLPECVRERMNAAWMERRAELEGAPPIPKFWEERDRERAARGGNL